MMKLSRETWILLLTGAAAAAALALGVAAFRLARHEEEFRKEGAALAAEKRVPVVRGPLPSGARRRATGIGGVGRRRCAVGGRESRKLSGENRCLPPDFWPGGTARCCIRSREAVGRGGTGSCLPGWSVCVMLKTAAFPTW